LKSATPQVSEILNSIKVIKMFAWERPLAQRISDIRCMEVDRLKQYGYISALQVRHLAPPHAVQVCSGAGSSGQRTN
jgi:hypothetical protein